MIATAWCRFLEFADWLSHKTMRKGKPFTQLRYRLCCLFVNECERLNREYIAYGP